MKKFTLILSTIFLSSILFAGCTANSTEISETVEQTSVESENPEEVETHAPIMGNISEIDSTYAIPKSIEDLPQFSEIQEGEPIAIMHTTAGDITIRLFPEAAPKAVENFTTLAKDGYYDGIKFHRVIPNFMIQSGDPDGIGTGGESIWGTPFEDEFNNLYRNFYGSLSMANSGVNTNGSQFFINQNSGLDETTLSSFEPYKENPDEVLGQTEEGYEVQNQNMLPVPVIEKYEEVGGSPHLDFIHTVFGQVIDGLDIVDNIANAETFSQDDISSGIGQADMPKEDILINSIEITEYK